ncbi:MAG: hypothetical protein GY838_10015 [bacterium]|nr:hypothetical protein [bacterium]
MITIQHDSLGFDLTAVHKDARLGIDFHRTLRIPDDDEVHFLPPGLGHFPLRNVLQHRDSLPDHWLERGGVMLPMFQSEAMWLNFRSNIGFPFLVMISAGGINAVTGDTWSTRAVAEPQNYCVVPRQPWLDGFCVRKGEIRQFVAMPLGHGYTAEEQITGRADMGGVQVVVYPMKAESWEKLKSRSRPHAMYRIGSATASEPSCADMGLGAGGRMRQEIYDDEFGLDAWEFDHGASCFVHIANSLTWRAITGEAPPTLPPTAKQYSKAGLPWFDWYDEGRGATKGSGVLARLKTIKEFGIVKGETPLPENESVKQIKLMPLGPGD